VTQSVGHALNAVLDLYARSILHRTTMICSNCASFIANPSLPCPSCGNRSTTQPRGLTDYPLHDFGRPSPFAPPPGPGFDSDNDDEQLKEGIGGWLLLLCIWLTILNPIGCILSMRAWVAFLNHPKDGSDGILHLITLDIIVGATSMLGSVISGLFLWQRFRHAVHVAQIYLVLQLCLTVIYVGAVLVLTGHTNPGVEGMDLADHVVGLLARSFIYFVIWFFYLRNSSRVRMTYRTVA